MTASAPSFIEVDSNRIAFRCLPGTVPGIVWLGGYKSDMLGTKAETLAGWASNEGHAFLRHDYSGHSESGGIFADGTISRWLAESLAVFQQFTAGPQVLVGSSMGAWIALRMNEELNKAGEGDRVAGLVLLAPASDFTAELIEPELTDAQRSDLAEKGYFEELSEYSPMPYLYTRVLIEDGRDNLVMAGPIHTNCPVHIIQGLADTEVPYRHALKLMSLLLADDATLSLVPNGDHRLSRSEDLELLTLSVGEIIARAG